MKSALSGVLLAMGLLFLRAEFDLSLLFVFGSYALIVGIFLIAEELF